MSGERPNGRATIDRIVSDAVKDGTARTPAQVARVQQLAKEAAVLHDKRQR
jgi:hypothetical protein